MRTTARWWTGSGARFRAAHVRIKPIAASHAAAESCLAVGSDDRVRTRIDNRYAKRDG